MVAGPAVAVRLLGPPELVVDGTPVVLPLGHRAAVLALLALHHPTGVGHPVIADGLWGPSPPTHAANAVQGHVSRLRKAGLAVERTGPQYRLTGDVHVDAAELDDLVAAGDAHLRAGRPAEAAERLRAALALFRGPVLAGLEDLPFAAVEIARLEGARAAAGRARIEADLRLGRYAAVLPELEALLDERPDDEGLLAMLMRALHGAGRHGDALAAYDRGRRRLVAEHGIAPSPALRALHQAMLDQTHRESPAPQQAPAVPRPRQTPHGPAVFVGRAAEVAELVELLAPGRPGGSAPIAAVDGPGGVGKTALAIQVADLLAPSFPDGVLFAALGGGDPDRAPGTEAVLGRFLTALGVATADVPADAESAAARYRTELAGRRVLVVLDDAPDAERVRPLLPVGGGCAALVTSRAPLALAEAVPVGLGLLPLDEAGELLRRVGRVAGAPDDAVVAVARACGRLPLALHIAGGRMANRPPAFAARLAELLADETRRLGELRLGDHDVRSSFAVSHRLLSPDEQRAFRLLSRWTGPTVPADLAAALLATPVPDAKAVLNRLVTARLLDEVEPGRYRFHDLLRLFGRELARTADAEGPSQEAALRRALHHVLDAAVTADAALSPGAPPAPGEPDRRGRDRAAALAWFEAELANLVAAAGLAADLPDPACAPVAWGLSDAAFRYLDFAKRWAEWTLICEHGVRAARRVGDAIGEATALNRLGCAYRERGRVPEARDCLERALDLARARAHVPLEMSVLNNLANTLQDAGLIAEAVAVHGEKLGLARRTGDRYNLAVALNNLGDIHLEDDDLDRARRMFAESRELFAELGELRALGMVLHNLGEVALRQGRAADAARLYRTGAERSREAGDAYSRAAGLVGLGHAHRALGDEPAARAAWCEAHPILAEIDPTEADEVAALAAGARSTRDEQAIQH
ncbi:ATP-binding protein [Pseudonocardia humida]|uniref:Tetratricopeptide repeat protein n=1 Tax=Pseudonocardia humida TaxID=2800819 RepID=A0ABT0ZTH8_9PSEU|nr:BTAD domain-containing putative transcriptional regulator [Pseudonocardia humida]MCO1654031.1 tetratricopeptide repeat protein [Pseudonocardia humida]